MSSDSTYLGNFFPSCLSCSKDIPKNRKFCTKSCSATYNNTNRLHSRETKQKISKALTQYHPCDACQVEMIPKLKRICEECKIAKKDKIAKDKIEELSKYEEKAPFSKLNLCTCKICDSKFVSRTSLQFCIEHRNTSKNLRMFYAFKFNVYSYPDLFDIKLLNEVGWYSPGGKSGKWNLNGLSRDHRVSISDAIKFGYDRFYITHPINCDLIPHIDNSRKKSKSSISYSDLVRMVNDYESRF